MNLKLNLEKVKADFELKKCNLSDGNNRIKLDEIYERITEYKRSVI